VQAQVSGTLSETEEDDATTTTGTQGNIGTVDNTEEDDTSTTSGSILVSGTIVEIEEDDTSTASAIQGNAVTGTLSETSDDDAITAAGIVELINTGTIVQTEEDDTIISSGTVQDQVAGTLNVSDDNDTLSASGGIQLSGSGDAASDDDTLEAALEITVLGTVVETEEDDTVVTTGGVYHSGGAAGTADDDTLVASGFATLLGTIKRADEEDDTLEALGLNGDGIFIAGDMTEGDDTPTATGIAPPEFTTLVSDITVITDKSSETNVINYSSNTYIEDSIPDTIVDKESITYLLSECTQGPAGPPTGVSTYKSFLPFVGSGQGSTKTTTGIVGNVIYEAFGINDAIYTTWIIPPDIDRSVDPMFTGTFFPTADNAGGFDSSWEIHISVHNADHTYEYSGIITANDLPLPDTGFEDSIGSVSIDRSLYLINDTIIMHIVLKRVTSSNDPSAKVGTSDLHVEYGTEVI